MPNFQNPDDENGQGRRRVSLSDANKGRRKRDFAKESADLRNELVREDREDIARAERNMSPDRIVEPRCDTCTHPYRDFIETMLIKGQPYLAISNRVSPKVDRRSISNHFKNHMDLQDVALRSILEEEAKIQGRNFEEGVNDIITKRAVLEVSLRKGYEDVVKGVTTVEPRDLIQIAKVLGEMDLHQNQIGLDELRAQVQIFIQAIKDVCDADTQNQIGQRVKQLRSREGVEAAIEKAMDPPEIAEATVVEIE